ncbi:outer membrane protein assembly factor BamE [Chachezhania sediminis]|uniref:outer membrane protein assembly factor BamE n=1 Tax=Chachezhania sediminis TaxID=2599291 RepID=UPI001E5F1E47|nr:outer membrane protein assembly factor BamE [Chachezhania sediminis]
MLLGVASVAALGVAGCTARYENHGYVPTEEDLQEIVVGVDTRESVAETVGPPSSSGVLDDSGYYYVQSQFRYYGAMAPKLVKRQLVAISFDSRGLVQNIERFDLKDGRAIPLTRRVTSSGVENSGFFRQLLGNLRSFDPGSVLSN